MSAHLDLTTYFTHHPGHATELCHNITNADYDVVVAIGGDGTVNEVINGLLGPAPTPRTNIPTLAVIPTGSANVFVRALGFPPEPIHATEALAHTLEQLLFLLGKLRRHQLQGGAGKERQRTGQQHPHPDGGHQAITAALLEVTGNDAHDEGGFDALAKHDEKGNEHGPEEEEFVMGQ